MEALEKPGVPAAKASCLTPRVLCCAFGLCVLVAGVNLTLAGTFWPFLPGLSASLVVGPSMVMVSLGFLTGWCLCNQNSAARRRAAAEADQGGSSGPVALELESPERTATAQDTMALQLSPASSPSPFILDVPAPAQGFAPSAPGPPLHLPQEQRTP
ncbi:transmembrane protein 275 [Suncus etruscus]|uniref:transmembrane protein 275 n=1 Tax=Suncus etruscus TaxID=109475 RepID=UPI00210FE2E2|nr:transmembrane protein 275 [Suncus etruscus]XP_049631050.1 transmembrane protein 275 [Suncus etruscus]